MWRWSFDPKRGLPACEAAVANPSLSQHEIFVVSRSVFFRDNPNAAHPLLHSLEDLQWTWEKAFASILEHCAEETEIDEEGEERQETVAWLREHGWHISFFRGREARFMTRQLEGDEGRLVVLWSLDRLPLPV